MKTGLRVAVLHNLLDNAPPPAEDAPRDVLFELDTARNVKAELEALAAVGHEAAAFEGDLDLPARLREWKPDLCFNTCEGYRGDSREAHVPALLEMLGLRYSGAKVLGLALSLDKAMTKRVLLYHGLPTPEFQVFYRGDDAVDPGLRFPLFVKPVREGTGMGITADSLVRDERALRERVSYLLAAYHEPVLVERYIEGIDITAGMIGNLADTTSGLPTRSTNGTFAQSIDAAGAGMHVLPMTQTLYDHFPPGTEHFYSAKVKVDLADDYRCLCPAPLSPEQAAQLRALAIATFWATGSLDFARVDFRLDADDDYKPYILEINALPGVTPISDMTIMANAQGWTHADMIVAIVNAALRRYGLPVSAATDPLNRVQPPQQPPWPPEGYKESHAAH